MMTSDVSLKFDDSYKKIVERWAAAGNATDAGQEAFDRAWKHAWYKLTARDMGPRSRCAEAKGIYPLPASEPWQFPLPASAPTVGDKAGELANFDEVRAALKSLIADLDDKQQDGLPYFAVALVKLSYQCAATFRATDWQGGCNGARVRTAGQQAWPANKGTAATLQKLQVIKDEADRGTYGGALSWADLIVLAGTVALEVSGGDAMVFCGGRTDASVDETAASAHLVPTQWGPDAPGKLAYPAVPTQLMYLAERLRLSNRELVVLFGGLHSLGAMENAVTDPTMIAPTNGNAPQPLTVWTDDPTKVSNRYFQVLLNNTWECANWPAGADQKYWLCNEFKPVGTAIKVGASRVAMLPTDLLLKYTPELKSVVDEFAHADAALFKAELAAVWTKLMNNDRFDGPTGNLCTAAAPSDKLSPSPDLGPAAIGGYAFGGLAFVVLAGIAFKSHRSYGSGGGGDSGGSDSLMANQGGPGTHI